jgi:dihydroneopterin aldolase
MDRIELHGMAFQGRHGARPGEWEQAQEFKVDVEIETDTAHAGKSDKLEDTVDYTKIRAAAREVIEGPSVHLLEALAAQIAGRVLKLPRVAAVEVRVAKRPASMQPIESAAVRIYRTRV